MNTIKPSVETPTVCSIVGCTGPYDDENSHTDENPEFNLHFAAGYDGDLPLDAHPTMDAVTAGRWKLYIDVRPGPDDLTAVEGLELARAIAEQAEHVQALNDALDAQAWFDSHPNPWGELVADVMRNNPLPVTMLILSRLDSAPVIDCSGHTVATAAGHVIDPESIVMQSLVNGDEARSVDRSRFFVNAAV